VRLATALGLVQFDLDHHLLLKLEGTQRTNALAREDLDGRLPGLLGAILRVSPAM